MKDGGEPCTQTVLKEQQSVGRNVEKGIQVYSNIAAECERVKSELT